MVKKLAKSISIVFPAYNESGNIAKTIAAAHKFANKKFDNFEIIVVDDGSSDETAEIVKGISKELSRVKLLRNKKNLGYGATVWKGLRTAKYDLVFFSDADRQFDLTEISKIIEHIGKNDVVIGYRRQRKDSFIRKLNAWGWKILIRLVLNLNIRDIDCAFKLFRREVIDSLKIKSTGATFSAELIYEINKKGYKIKEMAVSHYPRLAGSPTGAKFSVIKKAFIELWRFYRADPSLVKAKSRFAYILGAVLLFASRLLMMSSSQDFFDSSEYAWRTNDASLWRALATGHAPFHPLYVFFSWLLRHSPFQFSETVSLELTSAILGSGGLIFLFMFIKKLFNTRVAWLSVTIFALLPFVWVSQITILVDATEHVFYFLALYLWLTALMDEKPRGLILALLSGLSLGAAGFAHTQVGIWLLGFLAMPIVTLRSFKKQELIQLIYKLLLLALGGSVFIFLYLRLLIYSTSIGWHETGTYRSAFNYLVFGNIGDRDQVQIRQVIYFLLALGSSLVTFGALIGSFKLFLADKRKFFFLAFLFLPFIIGSTYVYENLYGRTLILGLVPLTIACSYWLVNLKRFRALTIFIILLQMLILSVPVVWRYRILPAPIEHIKETVSSLETGGIFISSNVTKTLANAAYKGEYVNFGDVGNGAGYVEEKIKKALEDKKPVFMLQDALLLPYHRYDGQYYDIRSTGIGASSEHTTMLEGVMRNYNVSLARADDFDFKRQVYKIDDKRDLKSELQSVEKSLPLKRVVFGRVSSINPVSGLIVNDQSPLICGAPKEDLTRLDVLFCLVRSLDKSKRISNWTFTDKDGWFYLAQDDPRSSLIFSANATGTRSSEIQNAFTSEGDIPVNFNFQKEVYDLSALEELINNTNGSFYVAAENSSGKNIYKLYTFDFKLKPSEEVKARDLGGEVSDIVRDGTQGKVRKSTGEPGYVVSGPYIDLDPGNYDLTFYARSNKKEDHEISFEVVGDYGREKFANQIINQKELVSNKYKPITLRIDLKEKEKALEFRARVPEGTDLLVKSLNLVKKK